MFDVPICAIGSSYALRILVQWIIDFLFLIYEFFLWQHGC